MEQDEEGEEIIKTRVYLQTVKRTTPFLKYADALSDVGGFYISIVFLLSAFVNCVNRKMYTKELVHDSYQYHYNKDYLCVP
jgi:hypothetical protein